MAKHIKIIRKNIVFIFNYFILFFLKRMSKKKEEQPRIHVPKEGGSSVQFSKTSTDMVSYEDLLIAQYLEELRKTKGEMRKKKE